MAGIYVGTVQQGARRAVALGFPTVNISLTDNLVSGIYAARLKVKPDESSYMAAVYADQKRKVLEAHILDFTDDLYGCEIEINLLHKIRDSKRFENDAALRAAISSSTF